MGRVQRAHFPTGCAVSLVFLLAVAPAAAQGLQSDYEQCVGNCRASFVAVEDNEKSCAQTVANIHNDLKLVKNLLLLPDTCSGSNAAACREFAEYALPAMDRLIALTVDAGDCLSLDSKAVQEELWLFDTARTCKGDGVFTDLHDFIGAKSALVEALTIAKTAYSYEMVAFDPFDDFHGHRPECEGGSRPAQKHFSPLFRYFLALESLPLYQSCMSSCRAPTEKELKVWTLEKSVQECRTEVGQFSAQLKRRIEERNLRLMHEHGLVFPCRDYSEQLAAVRAHDETLTRFSQALRSLLEEPAERVGRLAQLEKDAVALRAAIQLEVLERADRQCREEDELAGKLTRRRKAIVDTVLRNETFSIEAAGIFNTGFAEGESCEWIGDCAMPLLCAEGKCRGEVSLKEAGVLLQEGRDLADRGLKLKLHDEEGLDGRVQRTIHDLEGELADLEKGLTEISWPQAVVRWREAYRKQFPERIDLLAAAIRELLPGQDETSTQNPRCRRELRRLKESVAALEKMKGTLGDADPLSRAKWVRLKSQDIHALQKQMKESADGYESECAAVSEEFSMLWLVVAAVVALAGAGAALLVIRFRRRGRR